MASEECAFKASVTEDEVPDLNSPEGLGNGEKYVKREKEGQPDINYDRSLSHVACNEITESKSDELFENVPELKKAFVIKSKIGEGTFSNVYLAHLIGHPDEMFALKHIIPTSSPDRVEREVRCLQEMGGKNNVIGYKGTIRHCDHNVIILPYFPHERFQDYLHSMTVSDIRKYMKSLLLALKHIHSFSIIHRDIKPGNFLHSRQSGRYNLVDFGLAMHEPDSEKAWDIEKKNGQYTKSSVKNTRQLSPESRKNNRVAKKQRTSPRVAVTSHKLARQPNGGIKTTSKATTAKQISQGNENKLSVVNARQTNRGVKFVAPSEPEKKVNGKSLLPSSKLISGLCQTKHKTFEVCSLCIKRTTQSAPRAGTSGFRAPEVLLKHPQQTTAVDVWSAGIVMLCLLSGKYPFFRCTDDMTALAQIITVFGKQRVMESTKHLGKYMVCNSTSPGYELKDLCQKLRFTKHKEGDETKCCSTCSKREVKNENECKASSPASNRRRTSLRASNAGKSIVKERDGQGTDSEGQRQVYINEHKDSISKKCSEIAHSKDKNTTQNSNTAEISTGSQSRVSRTENVKSNEAKPYVNIRNGHSPLITPVDAPIPESNDPRSNSVSDVISLKLKAKTKVRFLSEGNRPLTENSEDCETGSGIGQEHLDGSRCTCDCGSCPEYVPKSAYDLLERCLDLNPATRITASEALNHPFLCDNKCSIVSPNPHIK